MQWMKTLCDIYLYTLNTHGYTYFVVLVVVSLIAAWLCASLWLFNRDKAKLDRSLAHLASLKRRGVEYELVLQAMNLATWKIDLRDLTVNFDNDYRTSSTLFTPPPSTPLKDVMEQMMPEDAEKLKKVLDEVKGGSHDIYHLQYRIKGSDGKYCWSDAYGMVAERDAKGRATVLIGTS